MAVSGLDHLYIETHSFDTTRRFWEGLGFKAVATWGEGDHRAGILHAGGVVVVLSQVAESVEPQTSIYFKMDNPSEVARKLSADPSVTVTKSLHESHWESQLIEVEDPDGHRYNLEYREKNT